MILLKVQACLLFSLLLGSKAMAEGNILFEKVVRYEETVADNRIELVIHQKKFDFSKYKISGGINGSDGPAKINGVRIAGTDGKSPASWIGWPVVETVAEIDLKWNGKQVSVPELLHVNLLRLSLDEGCIQFIPRPSGEELLIQATGGDGGAAYLVSLVLRKNGQHKQYEADYWEDGLRPYPYMIGEVVKEDSDGVHIKEFPWLEPRTKPDAATSGGK